MVQRERWTGIYSMKCAPLVYPGQVVLPDQPVLRLEPAKSLEPDGHVCPCTEIVPSGLAWACDEYYSTRRCGY